MVAYEETSSLQVLGTVTADAVVTVSLGLFSFDGSISNALVPPGLLTSKAALAACLGDVLLMLLLRATVSAAAVTGTKALNTPCGLFFTFLVHSAMATWMATKAVFAVENMNSRLDIVIPGSDATVHVWWLFITLIMSALFGFAEHSLCVAWAATFRGERLIEMSNYGVYRYRAYSPGGVYGGADPLLVEPLLPGARMSRVVYRESGVPYP